MDQELAYGVSTWGNIENQGNRSSTPIANNDDANNHTDPQLVHQSARTSIYRHQDRGIKILLGENLGDPQPHQWQIARLENELNVSRSLPHTCNRRAVVGSQPFGGQGLSGTGPKAGGPHYLPRFANERVVSTDTTAAGGNAALMTLGDS